MMRKITACFLLIFVIAVSVCSAEYHKVFCVTDENGDEYYLIPETIKIIENNNIFVSIIRTLYVSQNGVCTELEFMAINPSAKQCKILGRVTYDQNGNKIDEKKFPGVAWMNVSPHTVADEVWKKVNDYINRNPEQFPNRGGNQAASGKRVSGSGFFITPDIVVTNNHVVANARQIVVTYNNEIKLPAVIIGFDSGSDLALLKVTGLEGVVRPLVLGNSSSVKEGARVYAVGFPLPSYIGTTAKISDGLVSSSTGFNGDLRQFQITAPVQPGNSGGPLLDEKGEVIGVVAAALGNQFTEETGIVAQNVNFAVKSNNIKNLIGNLGLVLKLQEPGNKSTLDPSDIMELTKKGLVFIQVVI